MFWILEMLRNDFWTRSPASCRVGEISVHFNYLLQTILESLTKNKLRI